MEEYFHITTEYKEDKILSDGLEASDALECPSGNGIHVPKTVMGAHAWIGQLRNERNLYDRTFVVLKIEVENACCREDEFIGVGPDDAYVICQNYIHSRNIEAVEWVY